MTDQNSSLGGSSELRIEQIEREARALIDAISQGQRARQLLFLLLIAFVAVTCFAYYKLATRFQQKEHLDALITKAQERLEKRSDFLLQETQKLVDHTAPVLSAAFYSQAKNDLPRFLQGMQGERDQLVENLIVSVEQKLTAHQKKVLERHQKVLEEEFPAVKVTDQQAAMIANLDLAFDKLVRKYYIERMRDEVLSMFNTWDEFPTAAPPAPDDPPTSDQFIGTLLEIVKLRMAESPDTVDGSQP